MQETVSSVVSEPSIARQNSVVHKHSVVPSVVCKPSVS